MNNFKIGIIGGGACGIGVGKALQQAGLDFEIIEASARLGGNWQPDGPASKMYQSAHLISSKKNTQFSDYPMPKDYSSYPSNRLFFDYLQNLANDFGLQEKTRLNTSVTEMSREGEMWHLKFNDNTSKKYDFVIVCNGLLRKPLTPEYPGTYTGESIHAINYKSHELFRNKRVLVVGGGNSGCDIAVDAAHSGKSISHSTRRGYYYMPKFIDGQPTQEWLMDQAPNFSDPKEYWKHVRSVFKLAGFDGEDFGLPAPDHDISECHPIMNSQILYYIGHGDITAKPDIERFENKTVHYTDGSSEEIDLIVWATGYAVDMPFLSTEIFDWRKKISSLFLRIVPMEFDNLLFIGYLNTPSGIGNLVNLLGKFITAYIKARMQNNTAWKTFQEMKHGNLAIDLGQERFMKTDRHKFEVDLWKYIKTINFITSKLNAVSNIEQTMKKTVSYETEREVSHAL
jgi:cation diffusion facilitator CzcD-associated flavoprotein CzcO